jgi:hypothetical protein
MANENDMSGRSARDAGETDAMKRVRQRAIDGDMPPSAQEVGQAIAEAMKRGLQNPPVQQKLGDVVRASVRAGFETTRQVHSDGSSRLVTQPKSVTFGRDETIDGREYTVANGRPVRLKREAYERRLAEGVVMLAE